LTTRPSIRRALVLLAALLPASVIVPDVVAAKGGKAEMRAAMREGDPDAVPAKGAKRDDSENSRPAKSAAASESGGDSRQLARLRERLGVTDDAEWAVIAARIANVEEQRRALASGPAARAPAAAADKNRRGAKSARPELDALRSAVADDFPEAEIRARLARAHEVHEQNEARLRRAHAELRAVLSIRQEAIAVMAGLLPP
ncbi:MAG: hypothetical protein RLZZ15_3026, partial [Verrucomicrobiota bacterium]